MKRTLMGVMAAAWVTAAEVAGQGLPANVWVFDADPFLEAGARVVASFAAPDWSSSPAWDGVSLQVTTERFEKGAGLVEAVRRVLAPAPAVARFVLVNQVAADIAVFDFGGRPAPVPGDRDGDGIPDDLPVEVEWVRPAGEGGGGGGLRWILPENAPEVVLEGVDALGGVWTAEAPIVREENGRRILELPVTLEIPVRFFRLRW